MNISLWRRRYKRFKSNPKELLKAFYYNKVLYFFWKVTQKGVREKRSYQDYFKEIPLFAQNYQVNSMRIGNEYIWPYLRNHLWVNINSVSIRKKVVASIRPYALQNGHYSQISQAFREKIKREFSALEIEEIEMQEIDFLFFTNINGTEQINIDDKIYYRITDPLYEVAKKMGNSLKIEMVKTNSKSIEKWDKYMYKSQLVLPPFIQKIGFHTKLSFDSRFLAQFQKHVPSLRIGGRANLNNVVNYEMHTRSYYLDLLKKLKPKVICLYGFHYQAPLISAADELGILTVDLQHGLQVGWNPLYNNYDELPTSGYQSLPDYFAVWGEKEYKNIQRTFASKKHKPIYMGNPWLKKLETFSHSLSRELLEKISDDKLKILIIMQNQTAIPKLFLEIINNSSSDIVWIVRHHPKGEKYISEDFSKTKNILIDDEIDDVLFNELFKYVHIAISEGSALALEASHYDVQNIITSQMGYENYLEEIENGIFYYLDDANAFSNILESIKSKEKKDSFEPFKNISEEDFLNTLLIASKNKTRKTNSLSNSLLPPETLKKDVEYMLWRAELQEGSNEVSESIKSFYKFRDLLSRTPSIPFLYEREQNIWIKESKIFKRYIQNLVRNSAPNIVMISDSLGLPRPNETINDSFGVEHTATYMFNEMNKNKYYMRTWAQRFLTTQKLLDNWSLMTGELKSKHLVIHLGLNDSVERIFLEEQRLAMLAYPGKVRSTAVEYARKYRKELISNQKNHSYVHYDIFIDNVKKIILKAKKENVASITFINIIAFPKSHEIDTPGSLENTQRFNNVFLELKNEFTEVNILDLNHLVKEHGFNECMLEDNMHLSHKGHKLLADAIMSIIEKKELYV